MLRPYPADAAIPTTPRCAHLSPSRRCEPWWNPFAEDQACDRVHRIGQQKDVRVLRLAVADTVEDRIMQLQEQKREVAGRILGDDARAGDSAAERAAAGRLSESDLAQLFGF